MVNVTTNLYKYNIHVHICTKSFNYEKVIQANSTCDFDFANKREINYFPFYSFLNVRLFFFFPLLLCDPFGS